MIPLCQCGCGQPVNLAKSTSLKHGWVKGEPYRFVTGHHLGIALQSPEAFWARVDKDGPIHPVLGTRCWLWMGRRLPFGYGQADWRVEGEVRNMPRLAHRVAWFLAHGQWPMPMALHHCDNPPCVNYETHLFEGNNSDNVRDCIAKGRYRRFRGNPR